MDEIESRMASFRSKLNQIGSQMERLSRLDVDQLNNTMERLSKVEESLLSLVRHLEVGTLKSVASVPAPGKIVANDLFPEFEALGSGKGKMEEVEGIPTEGVTRVDRDTLSRKLELPIFYGNNPDGWFFRANRYFDINKLTSAEKLRATVVCLEGDALA